MGKIKLSLVSGAIVEKPLINAFKANNSSYVVLDNEMNGSMGLPIILVCKLENNKLIKIEDKNEWQIVKEYLKNIIAGNQIEFISIPNELQADDIYYTQLTLPVPSFDALKNSYNEASISTTNVVNPVGATSNPTNLEVNPSVIQNPVDNTAGIMDINFSSNGVPSIDTPVVNNQEPVMPTAPNVEPTNPNVTPVSAENGVAPTIPPQPEMPPISPIPNVTIDNNVSIQPVTNPEDNNPINPGNIEAPTTVPPVTSSNEVNIAPNEPVNMGVDVSAPAIDLGMPIPNMGNVAEGSQGPVGVNPVIEAPVPNNNSDVMATPNNDPASVMPQMPNNEPVSQPINDDIFKDQKEAFMQACENMFNALVQKFEKELEKRK